MRVIKSKIDLVAALGDVLEKVLIDFGKLIQRIGAVRLYERLDI